MRKLELLKKSFAKNSLNLASKRWSYHLVVSMRRLVSAVPKRGKLAKLDEPKSEEK
jgi:hypothetical protein